MKFGYARSLLAASLVTATACTSMLHAMQPKPRTADNPLVSGQPLETSQKSDVGVVGEQDCNIWPFEDTMRVTVTEAQICVEEHKNQAAPPGWTGEPTADRGKLVSVGTDAGADGTVNVEKGHAAKVASCFNKGFNQQVAIWAFDYKGCAPNNGLVTATSKSFHVGSESWQFAGATTAAQTPPKNPS
jgi:hypothetical protein